MPVKLTLQDVIRHGKKHGYVVLSKTLCRRKRKPLKIKIKWVKCGHVREGRFDYLKLGIGCGHIECLRSRLPSAQNRLVAFGKKNGFELKSRYVNNRTKIKIKWAKCGHVCHQAPGSILNSGAGCLECGCNQIKERSLKTEKLHDLSIVRWANRKIVFVYNKCGHFSNVQRFKNLERNKANRCWCNRSHLPMFEKGLKLHQKLLASMSKSC